MRVDMKSHRLVCVTIMITAILATCAQCVQSAPPADVGPGADPSGPRCGPDDGVEPGSPDGGAAVCWTGDVVPPLSRNLLPTVRTVTVSAVLLNGIVRVYESF